MKEKYRVSVDGWSRMFDDKDEALRAARKYADEEPESSVKVFNMFNNVIWEN